MKVAFFSNFLNHHQLPLCQSFYRRLNGDFRFIATTRVPAARRQFGYADLNNEEFVIRTYEGKTQLAEAIQWANKADVVIIGSAPYSFITERLKNNQLTFIYSERLYRNGYQWWKWPVRLARHYKTFGRYKNLYLLCASAYTSADYAKTFTFRNKAYKWGYFPEVKRYDDFESIMNAKQPMSILWAGRFLALKHPEHVIEVANRLKTEGYEFVVNMLGNGKEQGSIAQMIQDLGLQEHVILRGAMSPEEVRKYMEEAQIYLFTSDRNEGWGAVLNESMNSGCAVVASDAIGAVPFLMDNEQNGLIYRSGNVEDLYQKVKYLLDNPNECSRIGKMAYKTMTEEWNAETAAERVLSLCKELLQGEKCVFPYTDGPCSKAAIIKDAP